MGGWTQTPNFILDALPDMKPAEVQVVMAIVRQTIGWKREAISLTMGELEEHTKMARASVVSGVRDALEHGFIAREPDGKSYIYRITEPPSVQILNRQEEIPVQILNSKEAESVQKVDRQSVQNLNPIKRNINTNKTEEERESAPARGSHEFFDPRKFVNGKVPTGTGSTPAEVFYEIHTAKDSNQLLSSYALATISEQVTDLARWRTVVSAWELSSFKATNIQGQLEWYRDGIPERNKSPSTNGVYKNGAASEEARAAIRTRAKLAQGELQMAQKFKGDINPQWQRDIDKARELGVL